MPKHKRKFIDKKHAVSFHLVHRSQRDPLQADEDATSRVLVPADGSGTGDPQQQRRAQQVAMGIYYDDDYDYTQHLRSRDEINEVGPGVERFTVEAKPATSRVRLPAEVLPSQEENDIGLLNMAHAITGPQPDWDPDIVEALEGSVDLDDPDNLLEDDFILKANGPADGGEYSPFDDNALQADLRKQEWIKEHLFSSTGDTEANESDEDGEWEDVDDDEEASSAEGGGQKHDHTLSGDSESCSDEESDGGQDDPFAQEETKSRFTSYSMSSSVLPRTKGLQLLDERFEQMYAQYDDSEIGALDHEDISGRLPVSSAILESTLEEFMQSRQPVDKNELLKRRADGEALSALQELAESDEECSDADDNEKLIRVAVQVPAKEKWDCESILSEQLEFCDKKAGEGQGSCPVDVDRIIRTYSTLYNHPKLLEEPKRPKDLSKVMVSKQRTVRTEASTTNPDQEHVASEVAHQRPADETAEERRARKQLVKLDRKKRREEKKATKDAFKKEQLRQEKEMLNVRQNLQEVRIV